MTDTTRVHAERTIVAPANVPRSENPLSPGVQYRDLIYVSGQTAADVAGVEAQTRAILDRIGAILRAAGSDYRGVLRCGVYLADIRTLDQMNRVYREYFPADQPARTTIECKMASPTVVVEIDCVAGVA